METTGQDPRPAPQDLPACTAMTGIHNVFRAATSQPPLLNGLQLPQRAQPVLAEVCYKFSEEIFSM